MFHGGSYFEFGCQSALESMVETSDKRVRSFIEGTNLNLHLLLVVLHSVWELNCQHKFPCVYTIAFAFDSVHAYGISCEFRSKHRYIVVCRNCIHISREELPGQNNVERKRVCMRFVALLNEFNFDKNRSKPKFHADFDRSISFTKQCDPEL